MSDDDIFGKWDETFLDEVIKLEEQAVLSKNPPPDVSYSPPREFTQTLKQNAQSSNAIRHTQNAKQQEIDRLKTELGRVSKHLTHLEQECFELRKERDKKEEQLTSVFTRIEAKDAEVHCTKGTNLEHGMQIQDNPGIRLGRQNTNAANDRVVSQINVGTPACKTVGVQTDKADEPTKLNVEKNDVYTHDLTRKLLAVWDQSSVPQSGKNLVSKLFVACETDLHYLFGCLSSNLSSRTTMDSTMNESSSNVAFQHYRQPARSAEAAQVYHLYSMLTKISNGMVRLEDLLAALVDLCSLGNVVIVHRSLRVLRVVLNHLFSMEKNSERRDNVMIEPPPHGNNSADIYGSECSEIESPLLMRLFDAEFVCKMDFRSHGSLSSIPYVDWVSLFELIHQIAMRNNEEHVKLEAVSVMNMIILRTNAYLEREKFGQGVVFQSVSQLLRKEAGIAVQKQAVHLLYLLLNCPKLLAMFCSDCKDDGKNDGDVNSNATNASSFEGSSAILEGLADCLARSGNDIQGLKLRRNAIILLAFLASSGKSGFEILLGHTLSKRTNFLVLILQTLVSEMDVEASEPAQPSEIFKERTLLVREALILLNRLVSNPQYSTPVLRVLTNSRDVACLTIDIANRLSRKGKWLWQSDTIIRQMRESEIVDLARVFKKRVFTFLGDIIS